MDAQKRIEEDGYDKYERVSRPDDPRRCQANNAFGQCNLVSTPGKNVCVLHGGMPSEKSRLNNYRLQKWQSRVAEMANSDGIKTLRDEIGILRMMLEEKLNSLEDVTDMITSSHVISDLVLKIEKLVVSCHKIEKSMSQLIDRGDIINLATQIIAIIEEVLTPVPDGKDLIAVISTRIGETLQQ
jgi:hypothetical protein